MHHFRSKSVFRWGRSEHQGKPVYTNRGGVDPACYKPRCVAQFLNNKNGVISIQIGVAKNTLMLRLLVKDTFRFCDLLEC